MPRPHPPMPLPLEVITMLFNENAANSSLRPMLCHSPGGVVPGLEPLDQADVNPIVAVKSHSLPTAVHPGHESCLWGITMKPDDAGAAMPRGLVSRWQEICRVG